MVDVIYDMLLGKLAGGQVIVTVAWAPDGSCAVAGIVGVLLLAVHGLVAAAEPSRINS